MNNNNQLMMSCDWINDKPIVLRKMNRHQLINIDADFTITMNGKIFFCEPYFPILDFLYTTELWIQMKEKADMNYVCVETEDNPLISFHFNSIAWVIQSPWQYYQSNENFEVETIIHALDQLKRQLKVSW